MRKVLFLFCLCLFSASLLAQVEQIVGDWKTVDDKTGEIRSLVHIYKATDGLYYGKVLKILAGKADAICEHCEGNDFNKPVEGMVIIRGMKAVDGELREGRVLDPESGKFYYAKLYIKEGNLILRGSLDKKGFLGRNQTWIPAK